MDFSAETESKGLMQIGQQIPAGMQQGRNFGYKGLMQIGQQIPAGMQQGRNFGY
jgi:hypothetical protein